MIRSSGTPTAASPAGRDSGRSPRHHDIGAHLPAPGDLLVGQAAVALRRGARGAHPAAAADDAEHGSAAAHPAAGLREPWVHAAHDRPAREAHRARSATRCSTTSQYGGHGRLRHGDRRPAAAVGHLRAGRRPGRGPRPDLRAVEPADRIDRSGVPDRAAGTAERSGRGLRLRRGARRAPPGAARGRHHHQAAPARRARARR